MHPQPDQLLETWLPGQISSTSMAVVGLDIFFVVDGNQIESTEVGVNGPRQTLATAPMCEGINQLAAAGHELAYVVTSPGGPTAEATGCNQPAPISWSIWLLDLNGGSPKRVASGVRDATSIDVAEFPVHLALTDTAYAFDRPPSAGSAATGETVEVHSFDGQTLWTSQTQAPVHDVLLGGNRLAVVTDGAPLVEGLLDLWVSDAGHPALSKVAQPATSASLSPDGSYLAWDLEATAGRPATVRQSAIGIAELDSGGIQFLTTLTGTNVPEPLRPSISSTTRGAVVAWFATAPGGLVYPALRYAAGGTGAVLQSLQEPVWMDIQDGRLFWVAESADGWSKGVFAVDLSNLAVD